MRDAQDINVRRAIVHIVNHRETTEPILSDAELDLAANSKLRMYFSGQVANALGDTKTVSVRFSKSGSRAAATACFSILKDETNLVSASQELVRGLFTAMGGDRRIVPGSLATCLYESPTYPAVTFLALIKLDPTEGLVQTVKERGGKRIVSFDPRGNVMPTTREKLHKAALVAPEGKDKKFDLLLLDRQVAATAAEFFGVKFLNTVPALDARTITENFYLGAQKAYNKLISAKDPTLHIDPEKADALQQQIATALQGEVIEIDDWVQNLPLLPTAKAVINEELRRVLPQDRRLPVDEDFARSGLLRIKRFRGDYGLIFEVESDHYDEVVKEKREHMSPDGRVITRLTIEVPGLKWVKR
jgi:hypothetical protein